MQTIALVGCGNLGSAIIKGLLASGQAPQHIRASRRSLWALQPLSELGVQTFSDNLEAIQGADIIILGLKPYVMPKVLAEIAPKLGPQQIVVSLATGLSLENLSQELPEEQPLVRAMPNTAADVSESLSCLAQKNCSLQQQKAVGRIFEAVGEAIWIQEELMEAATILGACGVAYVLRFIRAMVQGGIQLGFDAQTAKKIVTQTTKGAAELLLQGGKHPEEEIDKVTTPRGCTIVGLNEMEHSGFSSALIKGILASFEAIEKK